jgi:hypothetical protein
MERKADTQSPQFRAALVPLLEKIPELKNHLHSLDGLLRLQGEPVWAIMPFEVRSR